MKKKKVIGIDINEVLRYHIDTVVTLFEDEFKTDQEYKVNRPFSSYEYLDILTIPYKKVMMKYLRKDAPENLPDHHYLTDKKGRAKADPLLFETVEENRTPQDQLQTFLYEDFILECFGSCPKTYSSVINDLHEIYGKYRNDFDFIIVSLEDYKSIPMTLFFLSKTGIKLPEYYLNNDPKNIWDRVDIMITANPKLLDARPKRKGAIKICRDYNTNSYTDIKTMPVNSLADVKLIDLNLYYNNSIFKLLTKYVKKSLHNGIQRFK